MTKPRLFIHIGYPKCGSTSLQNALAKAPEIFYPTGGNKNNEHLSLPLYLKGLDAWTAQWVDQKWVDENHAQMLSEISAAKGDAFISSERLAALSETQIGSFPIK